MKFSLYSKKNQLDEMQEQTMRKIESHGFWLLWYSLLAAWIVQTVFGAAGQGRWRVGRIHDRLHLYGCRVSAQWSVGTPLFGYAPGQCRVFSGGCGGGYADHRVFPWILGRCRFCRCFCRHPVLCIAAAVRRIDTQTARASG